MNTVTSAVYSINFAAIWTALLGIAAVAGKALLVFLVCRVAMNLLMRVFDSLSEKINLDQGIKGFARSVIKIGLWAITIIIVAGTLGIETASLVAVLSVASLALSLSVQNILTDVFSGITILMSRPFAVGQFVEIAGVSGTVTAISIMRTTLETPDHKEILIPNSEITASKIINYSSEPIRRVDVAVSASYNCAVQDVIGALCAAGVVDKALSDPAPVAYVTSYGESAINCSLRVWCNNADYWDVFFAVNQNVKKTFEERNIEMTYPHLNVHLDN